MAGVKTVRGTLHGATVETSEDNAKRLGTDFVPEKPKVAAKKASPSKTEK